MVWGESLMMERPFLSQSSDRAGATVADLPLGAPCMRYAVASQRTRGLDVELHDRKRHPNRQSCLFQGVEEASVVRVSCGWWTGCGGVRR